jgi:hypothetical protein
LDRQKAKTNSGFTLAGKLSSMFPCLHPRVQIEKIRKSPDIALGLIYRLCSKSDFSLKFFNSLMEAVSVNASGCMDNPASQRVINKVIGYITINHPFAYEGLLVVNRAAT